MQCGLIKNMASFVLLLCSFFYSAQLFAMWDRCGRDAYAFPEYHGEDEAQCCPPDHPYYGQTTCDGCYELFVHYEPCCYKKNYCVEDQVPCQRRCLRYVDRYYEVRRYRYVPEYYNVTIMQREPEYYYEQDSQPVLRTVEQFEYGCIPQYYWKPVCPSECCCE